MNDCKVSVIIPTMNRPNTLARTLRTIAAGSCLPAQIVIVDQSQNKDIAEQNRALAEKIGNDIRIDYIYQAEPSSTKARNRGISASSEDILIFSDDDVDLEPDTVGNIARLMESKDLAMIAGIDKNSGISESHIGYILGTKSFINRNIGHVTASILGRYPDRITEETATQWAMGYFFAVRRSLLDAWSIRWDENLIRYAYNEDLDFTHRYYMNAKESGMRCVLTPQVQVRHLVSKEYRAPSATTTYMYVLHRLYIACKLHRGHIGIFWCDLWRLAERIVRRESPGDLVRAYRIYFKNRQAIRSGDIARFLP